MRAKWSAPIRKYWKISEQMMVKYCDLAICDSLNIEKYIHECYDGKGIKGRNPKTTFIAYGADLIVETYNSQELLKNSLNSRPCVSNRSKNCINSVECGYRCSERKFSTGHGSGSYYDGNMQYGI